MSYASLIHARTVYVLLALIVSPAGLVQAQNDDTDTSFAIVGVNVIPMDEERVLNSANTWDSLAEVVLYVGDRERALEIYRKALEVDPGFTSAVENIEKILHEKD